MAFGNKVRSASKTKTSGLLAMNALFAFGLFTASTVGQAMAQDATLPSPLPVADEAILDAPTVNEATLITPTSMGEANTCLTLEEIQHNLSTVSTTIVDQENGRLVGAGGVLFLDADGELAIYAPVYGEVRPEDKLRSFITSHPNYQTAEGVGPGTLIEEAERLYGPASLSYHWEAESREFVTFENGPENISFRTDSFEAAGVYPPQEGPYFQTESYREGATIQSVWITDRSCFDEF